MWFGARPPLQQIQESLRRLSASQQKSPSFPLRESNLREKWSRYEICQQSYKNIRNIQEGILTLKAYHHDWKRRNEARSLTSWRAPWESAIQSQPDSSWFLRMRHSSTTSPYAHSLRPCWIGETWWSRAFFFRRCSRSQADFKGIQSGQEFSKIFAIGKTYLEPDHQQKKTGTTYSAGDYCGFSEENFNGASEQSRKKHDTSEKLQAAGHASITAPDLCKPACDASIGR